ncbi:hypothetical protein GCM10027347_44620 [Larkinella harenae]
MEVNHDPKDQHWSSDSVLVAKSEVDSTAIYRCDTCQFAKAYNRATRLHTQHKKCATCPWETLSLRERKNNVGDLPEPDTPESRQPERIADTVKLKSPGDQADSNFP